MRNYSLTLIHPPMADKSASRKLGGYKGSVLFKVAPRLEGKGEGKVSSIPWGMGNASGGRELGPLAVPVLIWDLGAGA